MPDNQHPPGEASEAHHQPNQEPDVTTTTEPTTAVVPVDADADLRAAVARVRAERDRQAAGAPTGTLGADTARAGANLPAELRELFEAGRTQARAQGYAAAVADRLRADQLEAAAAVRQAQVAGRDKAWRRSCPARYAGARVTELHPQQDPGGRVSGWFEHGGRNLVAKGPSRHGKTHLAYAIGHQARAAGLWVVAWSAPAFLDAIRPGADDHGEALHHAMTCDLLIIDDLGRDRDTDWTRERFYRVFDARVSGDRADGGPLRTIVTTNEDYDDLLVRYGDPIMQRINEDATVVVVKGRALSSPSPW